MSTYVRRGTFILVTVISLLSLWVVGVAYAADHGLSGFDVLQHTLGSIESTVEGAAIRSGYDDTELHLAASIPIGALGAQLAYSLLPEKTNLWAPLVVGVAFGMLPGLAKEFYDASQVNNYFSTKDLGYDFLGSIIGVGITYSVHLLATHLRRKTPAMKRSVRDLGARMTGPTYRNLIPNHARDTTEFVETK